MNSKWRIPKGGKFSPQKETGYDKQNSRCHQFYLFDNLSVPFELLWVTGSKGARLLLIIITQPRFVIDIYGLVSSFLATNFSLHSNLSSSKGEKIENLCENILQIFKFIFILCIFSSVIIQNFNIAFQLGREEKRNISESLLIKFMNFSE